MKAHRLAFFLIPATILFVGCNRQSTNIENTEDEDTEVSEKPITFQTFSAKESNNAIDIDFEATLPEPDGDQVLTNICTDLLSVFRYSSSISDPQAILDRKLQEEKIRLTEIYNEMLESSLDDPFGYEVPQMTLYENISHVSSNKYFMTFAITDMMYEGGAHGGSGKTYKTYDMTTGYLLDENSFLTNKSAVSNLLRTKALKEYTRENPDFDVFDKDNISANGNFLITPDSIVYQFGEYEIAAYCYGRPAFRLNKNDVKPYIKPNSPVYLYWFGE
ncbi:MAG: DUF3298 domain-containing protein [Bacteroidales bacterium]|nr:DUF3298 domain-containing protein [Bacteroidales bacterium]